MAKRNEPYRSCIVESYYPLSTAGLHGPVHIRPIAGQPFPTHLHVWCNKDLTNPSLYKVGTRFRLRAKLTDRHGSGDFVYSYFGWPVEVEPRNMGTGFESCRPARNSVAEDRALKRTAHARRRNRIGI